MGKRREKWLLGLLGGKSKTLSTTFVILQPKLLIFDYFASKPVEEDGCIYLIPDVMN
jgi:hypothetical protein